jgi:hypothetical protein
MPVQKATTITEIAANNPIQDLMWISIPRLPKNGANAMNAMTRSKGTNADPIRILPIVRFRFAMTLFILEEQ